MPTSHAFLNLDLGRGSAAAIIGGLIILVVGIVLYRLVDRIGEGPDAMAIVRQPLIFARPAGLAPAHVVRAGAVRRSALLSPFPCCG